MHMDSTYQTQTTVCYNYLTPPFRETSTVAAASASAPNFLSPKFANRDNASWPWSHNFFPLFWTYLDIEYMAQQTKPSGWIFILALGLRAQFSAFSCSATCCKEKQQRDSCQLHFKVHFQVPASYIHSMRGMSKTLEGSREGEVKAGNSSFHSLSLSLSVSISLLLSHSLATCSHSWSSHNTALSYSSMLS